jgi:hypothetical protein
MPTVDDERTSHTEDESVMISDEGRLYETFMYVKLPRKEDLVPAGFLP